MIRTEFPHEIRELENIWIPLRDGTRLAARIWLPVDAEKQPVPALLEYLPYRKNDGTAVRDSIRHPYLAGHGYACVRADMRGSGDADGILFDEYLPQEQADGVELIDWIAAQSWCTGQVGMFGKSWGGFNALQIAALRPAPLRAIITIASTDDRYADDVHYMGGCVLAYDMLPWASIMLAGNAAPPDPHQVGERWREMWLDRIERTPPYIEAWLTHQRRDAYWRHGSVCENYGAIDIPVYVVGGWADGYTNAIPRLLAGLTGPRLGLIGPWSHHFPEKGVPGPAIGFLQESLRWWDHWLKGEENGIQAEPMLRVWLQESVPPRPYYEIRPGRWVAEKRWPAPAIAIDRWQLLADGRLSLQPGATFGWPQSTRGVLSAGFDTQAWCPYGQPGDFAPDQRGIDGCWLSFTTPLLEAGGDFLGFPEIDLRLAVDRPVAQVAVRLCDVAADGASTLVSWGVLNLTHRHGHAASEPVPVGQPVDVTVQLNAIGQSLRPGHAWRVSVSPTYFPQIWPSPEEVTLTLLDGRLRMPRRMAEHSSSGPVEFPAPETAPVTRTTILRPAVRERRVERDLVTGRAVLTVVHDDGQLRFEESGLEMADWGRTRYEVEDGAPLSAGVYCERRLAFRRGDWDTRIATQSRMTADASYFYVTNQLEAFEGTVRVAVKKWAFKVPRDGV